MADINLKSAQSVAEFIRVVGKIKPATSAGLWFRGQSSAAYQLTPGVLREVVPLTDGLGRPVKRGQIVRARGGEVTGPNPERMLAAFKRQARPFTEWSPTNDFEWMFIAQHHGLPTRLLDWSTNALVALYFAASGAEARSGDGDTACKEFRDGRENSDDGFAVFAIEPGALNNAVCDISDPIDVAADPDKWAAYLRPAEAGLNAYAPICVEAPHIASRIKAQSGVFTLHGANIDAIDYYYVFRPLIVKVFFPFTCTKEIMLTLNKLGVNRSFIYPGLDSIARDISDVERLRYQSEREAYLDRSAEESE